MEIKKIDPPFWFTGLKSNKLQLLVYGEDLNDATIETNLPHQTLEVRSRCHSLLISIVLKDGVLEGFYTFTIITPCAKTTIEYEFKKRRVWTAKEATISNADVIYMAMPDRFAKKDNGKSFSDVNPNNPNLWHGGNIPGMTDSLDYLSDLGVTAFWHTPIFKNSNYHGYSITDFYGIDQHFGNVDEYVEFVRKAHEKGIKVVMDVVFNHCSIEHPWLSSPPADNWFNGVNNKDVLTTNYKVTTVFDPHGSDIDRKQTVNGWFTKEMPDLNLGSKYVLCYLTQMTKWWIETAGIDAIRMDTYLYSNLDAMICWQNELSKEYPHFSIIAETWVPDAAYTSRIQNEVTKRLSEDSSFIVMDFAFQKKIEQYFDKKSVYDKESSLYYHFVDDFLYFDAKNTLAFLDNHDLPRWCANIKSKAKLKQAIGILLTAPRIPQLYYGTEFMVSGNGANSGDGKFRVDTFESIKHRRANEITDFMRKILQWRKSTKAVTKGDMKHFIPQKGVYVYFRTYENDKVMIISNNYSKTSVIKLNRYEEELADFMYGIDVVTGKTVNIKAERMSIRKNEILILELLKNEYYTNLYNGWLL